jgi:antibiotic biosynthesis monooxygenase
MLYMLKPIEMDENVTLAVQLEEEEGGRPVILINKFNVKPKDLDQLLNAWTADAAYLKQKPGFIYSQLHRGIGGSCVFINYAVWESVRHTLSRRQAILHLGRRLHLIQIVLRGITLSFFRKVAVSGICVD